MFTELKDHCGRCVGVQDNPGPDTEGSAFSSYDGDFRLPLVLGQGSPIIHSSCEGELGVALE